MSAENQNPLTKLQDVLCSNERQSALLRVIEEKLHTAVVEMQPGKTRDRELYECWLLIGLALETHGRLDAAFSEEVERLLAARIPSIHQGEVA